MWLDPDKIDQILGNLVENAVRHGAGTVTIVVQAAHGMGQVGGVAVSVSDQGEGIAPEFAPRVFRQFWRAKRRSGTGLGLFIVKGLVEAQGGTISCSARRAAAPSSDLPCPPGRPTSPDAQRPRWAHRLSFDRTRACRATPQPFGLDIPLAVIGRDNRYGRPGRRRHRPTATVSAEALAPPANAIAARDPVSPPARGAHRMSAPNKSYDPVEVTQLSAGELERMLGEARAAIGQARNLDELKAARLAHAGDRSPLKLANREIGALPPAARAEAGKRVGVALAEVRDALAIRQAQLEAERDTRVLTEETVDVTLPADRAPHGARHPITTLPSAWPTSSSAWGTRWPRARRSRRSGTTSTHSTSGPTTRRAASRTPSSSPRTGSPAGAGPVTPVR